MTADPHDPTGPGGSPERRLDSWKEIAAHLRRHVTTVRRWEKCEGLPVHRHAHDKLGSVYAFASELDEWWRSRRVENEQARRRANNESNRPRTVVRPWMACGSLGWMAAGSLVLYTVVAIAWGTPPRWGRELSSSGPAGDQDTTRSMNTAAYQEYVIGRYHLWRDTEANLERAIAHFERATELDPDYTAAYASLAHAWWKLGLWGRKLPVTESPARAAALRALQLDDTLPDTYAVMADLERLYGGDLIRAEALVKRALALDPAHADAHYTYGLLLMTLGRFDEAISQMESAANREPLLPAIQSDYGRVLYRARRYDEAIARLNRALELEPGMGWLIHSRLADVYEQLGQYDHALAALRRASGVSGQPYKARFARILAYTGRHLEARRLLRDLEETMDPLDFHDIASIYVALGDHDRAFATLYARLEQGRPGPNFVPVDPPFDRLRADPRWGGLVRRVQRTSVGPHVSG